MRRVCLACSVAEEEAAAALSSADAIASGCAKCGALLTPPTVFDCARIGLLPELQEIIAQVAALRQLKCKDNHSQEISGTVVLIC